MRTIRRFGMQSLGRLAGACLLAAMVVAHAASPGSPTETTAQVEFSPGSTVAVARVTVRLTAKTGVVRYTMDGSLPSAKSPAASGPLTLTATTRLLAQVFDGTRPLGPVAAQTYVVLERELESFRSNLPLVILNTFGRPMDRHVKQPVAARFIDARNGRATLLDAADFDGGGAINYRGNSSLRYLKRSFSLKTQDAAGKALGASILGFPADSDWVLYAPYPDKTLMRDVLAYELFNQMGHYASRTKFVEVFVNEFGGRLTPRHYQGVFVLAEKIKRSPDRVNIQKLTTNDNAVPNITGGYLFKKDHPDRTEEVTPTEIGWPEGRGPGMGGMRGEFLTGPGGFPADPRGFLPAESSRSGGRFEAAPGARRVIRMDGNRVVIQGDGEFRVQQPAPAPGNAEKSLSERLTDWFRPAPDNRGGVQRDLPARPSVQASPNFRFRGQAAGFGVAESGEQYFVSSQGNQFFYVEPKQEDITPAQRQWLLNHLNQFERALHGPDFADPAKGYAAYLDVDSFIDQHLLVEVTKNIDGFRFSTFFTKDRMGKIRLEPPWDWNLSFGNANGKQGWLAEYWYWPQLDDQQYSWFRRLFEDPDFGQRYVDRWGQLSQTVFAVSNLHARIDALAAQLDEAQRRNFERWPILGKKVWPNYYVGQSYTDEVRWMKQWIARRLGWIGQQFVAAPGIANAQPGAAGRTVTLHPRQGAVYFTLDGSDPRLPGGGVSPKAQLYKEPIRLLPDARLFARARFENRWSPPAR